MKIFTIAYVPDELAHDWVQHLRDFDTAHPFCHFEIAADAPNLSLTEMVEVLKLSPELRFADLFRRPDPLGD